MKSILTIILAGVSTLATAQTPPPAPAAPPTPEVYVSRQSDAPAYTRDPHARTFQNMDSQGYRKHVKFNSETGELFLQYHFFKNNEEFVFEKTVNATDKSERERQGIIDKFEREIELPGKGVSM